MPVTAAARTDVEGKLRGGTKKTGKKAGKQKEMSFVAKLDPSVAYHPNMIAQLRKMGITLEPEQKKQNKIPITIRLDPDVVETLRAMGEGWQPKTNELLRKWLKLDRSS